MGHAANLSCGGVYSLGNLNEEIGQMFLHFRTLQAGIYQSLVSANWLSGVCKLTLKCPVAMVHHSSQMSKIFIHFSCHLQAFYLTLFNYSSIICLMHYVGKQYIGRHSLGFGVIPSYNTMSYSPTSPSTKESLQLLHTKPSFFSIKWSLWALIIYTTQWGNLSKNS